MAEQNLEHHYKNPYLFNAKELDRETGLYYYGARYYNPKLSIWYGVDPLTEKMPSWSPYAYTFNNPVKFTDPTGMEPDDWVYNYKTNKIYWNENAVSPSTVGENETYLGKYGIYTNKNNSFTRLNPDKTFENNSLTFSNLVGVERNLDPLIKAGENGPLQSFFTFHSYTAPNGHYLREIPNYNSPEYAMSNPSGRLAVAGLYGLQGAVSGIATEFTLAKVGLVTKLSWSASSVAGDGLGGLGVQTTFSSEGISMGQAVSMIPANFSYIGGLNKGKGFKFADPATRGSNQILLEYGNPASRDALHSGPYIKVNHGGSGIERIPLQGNPVLNIGR